MNDLLYIADMILCYRGMTRKDQDGGIFTHISLSHLFSLSLIHIFITHSHLRRYVLLFPMIIAFHSINNQCQNNELKRASSKKLWSWVMVARKASAEWKAHTMD